MTFLKVLLALLGAAACLIPYLALTEEYERAMAREAGQARVLSVEGDAVRYEVHEPGSRRDTDGDGWVGPHVSRDVPEAARSTLRPGDALVARGTSLELALSRPTPLFLAGFVACLLFGVWSIVAPIFERRALEAAKSDPVRVIELMTRKTRTTKLVAALLLFAMGGGIVVVGVIIPTDATWETVFLVALGAVGLGVAAYAAYGAWEVRDPKNAPLLRAVREEPQRVVWIYEHVVTVNQVPTYHVYVLRDDGRRYDLNLAQLEPTPLIQALSQMLPHAIIGYSPELLSAYQSSPATFLQHASGGSAPASAPAADIPAIPAYPSPAYRLGEGIYMFGQLWRFDGRAWTAELGDDCEPVVAIFDAGRLGTCAVTWDSVYRRASAREAWVREYQSPGGRPRLSSGWGHPVHGLFAVGDRGTVLRSRGDGAWHREPAPDAFATVVSAVWGDHARLYLGTADGRIASRPWNGEWEVEGTPTSDFILDGACAAHGVYAVAQSGHVLFKRHDGHGWKVEQQLPGAARGLAVDGSRVWVSSRDGVLRSDRPGEWVREETPTDHELCALAWSGAELVGGGARCIVTRRHASGACRVSPPGRSGTIQSLWVGGDGELLVGTDFMIEVGANGRDMTLEPLATVRVA